MFFFRGILFIVRIKSVSLSFHIQFVHLVLNIGEVMFLSVPKKISISHQFWHKVRSLLRQELTRQDWRFIINTLVSELVLEVVCGL